jgi:hypothetical protein
VLVVGAAVAGPAVGLEAAVEAAVEAAETMAVETVAVGAAGKGKEMGVGAGLAMKVEVAFSQWRLEANAAAERTALYIQQHQYLSLSLCPARILAPTSAPIALLCAPGHSLYPEKTAATAATAATAVHQH